jgi:carbon storage regulator
MLVLSRRIGEEIVIDGDICLTVVSVQGHKVGLGIVAPPSVRVDRRGVLNEGRSVDGHQD